MTTVDGYGRVVTDVDRAVELIYSGGGLADIFVEQCPDVDLFNKLCDERDMQTLKLKAPPPIDETPEQYHDKLSADWLVADEIKNLDVKAFLLSLCFNERQKQRIEEEMALYKEKRLEHLLRIMIILVDHFRRNNIIWGVGRGSSVSSYALYLIGAHKIDSLKYDLDIREFLK